MNIYICMFRVRLLMFARGVGAVEARWNPFRPLAPCHNFYPRPCSGCERILDFGRMCGTLPHIALTSSRGGLVLD